MEEEQKPLLSYELMINNFVEAFGYIEMVTGIVPVSETERVICHTGWHSSERPEGIMFHCYGISVTKQWLDCFFLYNDEDRDHAAFVEKHFKYVHEVQNYIRLFFKREAVLNADLLNQILQL